MFGINDNIFGYIAYKSDMTQDVIRKYKNSLIFIGDEQQIYHPLTNTYIGVGLSAIRNINNMNTSTDKIYIIDVANSSLTDPNTTYYFPVIAGNTSNTYYYTYVALNVGVNPVTGKFIGGLEGTADYSNISHVSNTVKTISTTTQSSYYVSFVNKNGGDSYSYVTNKLLYDPGQKILTSTYFSGELLGHATSATYATYSTYTTYTTYSLFNSYQSIHRLDDTNKNLYVTFASDSAYSLSYVDMQFYYNPAFNCVYFGTAYGNIYGSADRLQGKQLNELFEEFKDEGSQTTYIKIGGVSKTLKIDADKLDGKHLNELFQEFKNGDNNCAYIKIGNVEKYVQLNSYTLDGTKKDELFTYFDNATNNKVIITIGGKSRDLSINADTLDGYHANNLLTYFSSGTISSNNNTLIQTNTYITVGGATYYTNGSTANIINSANWAYVGSVTYSNTTYNLALRYKVNGIDSAYAYIPKLYAYSASYIDGISAYGLFTQFENTSNQTTRITIGGKTRDLQINADKLDGYHANGLLQDVRLGKISSSGNTLTQENTYVKVGNKELGSGYSKANIINSANWSYVGSTTYIPNTAYNLVIRYKVNGVQSSYAYIPKIYAYSASYIDGISAYGLFTQFENTSNQTTRITIGGKTRDLQINADKLDGKHLSELFTQFINAGTQTTRITVGGITKDLKIDADTTDGLHVHGGRNNEANKIVRTDANGYIQAGWINTTSGDMNSTTFDKIFVSDDNYIRYVSKSKFAEALRDEDIITIIKSLTVTEAWMDTGINTDSGSGKTFPKGDGTYAIQINIGNSGIYSGVMSIFNSGTGSESEEIILHSAKKSNFQRLYIRTVQTSNGYSKIQIAAASNYGGAYNITFKFRKLI